MNPLYVATKGFLCKNTPESIATRGFFCSDTVIVIKKKKKRNFKVEDEVRRVHEVDDLFLLEDEEILTIIKMFIKCQGSVSKY